MVRQVFSILLFMLVLNSICIGTEKEKGLKGWWTFDEKQGTAAKDNSENGNNGTIYGAKWTEGKIGSGLEFNSGNDYVDCGNGATLSPTNAITVELWANSSIAWNSQQDIAALIRKSEAYDLYVHVADGNVIFKITNSNDKPVVTRIPLTLLSANKWYYFVGTYDGNNVKLYLNGELENTQPQTGEIYSASESVQISGPGPGRYFKGIIDEVKIYNRALTDEEIYEDWLKVTGPPKKESIKPAVIAPKEEIIVKPLKPSWAGSNVGRTNKVLKPWTPVETKDNSIRCWGREYLWGILPFPEQVISQGHELLSGPIRLRAIVRGEEVKWEPIGREKPARLVSTEGSSSEITRTAQGKGIEIDGNAIVEFDGMIRIDFSISALSSPVEVDSFIIEIPYKKEWATLMHYWPLHAGVNYIANSGSVPNEPFATDFRPLWWLGSEEDGGMCWFAESDEGWNPERRKRAIEIIPQGQEVLFRINIWGIPRMIDKPQKFTMGLQATPVKPWLKDGNCLHVSGNLWYGAQAEPRRKNYGTVVDANWLDYQKKMGVDYLSFGSDWTDIQAYVKPARPEEFRSIIDEVHKQGMKAIPYFGFEMSDIAPEWPMYNQECRVLPNEHYHHVTPAYSATMPEQRSYAVCYRSHWVDFIIEGMNRIKQEYKVDGVYLDGTASPWPCANQNHGCGYIAEDGSVKPTYPIFAVRDLMKRINNIFAQESDGIIIAHSSSASGMMPTLAFVTCHMDGEHLSNMPRLSSPLKTTPLDAFRAEFMGHNWGVPQLLLDCQVAQTTEELMSISLLHDVTPRTDLTIPGLAKISAYWHAFDDFGTGDAEWFPYWRNKDYVSVSHPDAIKVSFYQRVGKGLLGVVSNLGDYDIDQAWVKFNSDKLGLPKLTKAVQSLTGEPMVIKEGRIELSLPKYKPTLILVQ